MDEFAVWYVVREESAQWLGAAVEFLLGTFLGILISSNPPRIGRLLWIGVCLGILSAYAVILYLYNNIHTMYASGYFGEVVIICIAVKIILACLLWYYASGRSLDAFGRKGMAFLAYIPLVNLYFSVMPSYDSKVDNRKNPSGVILFIVMIASMVLTQYITSKVSDKNMGLVAAASRIVTQYLQPAAVPQFTLDSWRKSVVGNPYVEPTVMAVEQFAPDLYPHFASVIVDGHNAGYPGRGLKKAEVLVSHYRAENAGYLKAASSEQLNAVLELYGNQLQLFGADWQGCNDFITRGGAALRARRDTVITLGAEFVAALLEAMHDGKWNPRDRVLSDSSSAKIYDLFMEFGGTEEMWRSISTADANDEKLCAATRHLSRVMLAANDEDSAAFKAEIVSQMAAVN